MGHIDEALLRANLDAAQGTGAETPAPPASPWRVGQDEHRDGPGPEGSAASEPAVRAPARRPVITAYEPSAARTGFDAAAIERLVGSKAAGPLLVEQFRSLAATLLRAQG